ncbi:MAG TPA: SBBP repeat-containing protein, partial [Blastocatellia bacterium]|nr:SBBP repeat-containing protein [Blastocatellia bacterium]
RRKAGSVSRALRNRTLKGLLCIALAALLTLYGRPVVGAPLSQTAGLEPASAPVLAFSTYFGGGGNEESNSISVDSAGNLYIAGFTDSINFPITRASQPNFAGGKQDAFVTKIDPAGRLIYSTYLGGNGRDNATAIAVDAAGNAYVTGYTDSTNFPVKGALQPAKAGAFSAFVTRLDSSGVLLSSTLLGGSVNDYGSSIAVDNSGSIYVAGIATSSDFPTANPIQPSIGGFADLYVAKLDPSVNRLVYSTFLGASGIEGASSIAVDQSGSVYVTGLTSSTGFRTVNAVQARHGGGFFDAFVTRLNPSGSQIVYSTYLGGAGQDRAFKIAVDSTGSAYVTGDTDSIDFPVANAIQRTFGGASDAFAAKLGPSGNQLVYSTYLGGSGIDGGTAISVDSAGNASVAGFTASTNFPTASALQPGLSGAYDGFVAEMNTSGAAMNYSTYLGGSGVDSTFGVASNGNACVVGVTDSTNFPVVNALQPANRGGTGDLFIAKITAGPAISNAAFSGKNLIVTGSGFDRGATILVNGQPQRTRNDDQNPATILIGKKFTSLIAPGQTVTLQVRNSDGLLSSQFRFTRP